MPLECRDLGGEHRWLIRYYPPTLKDKLAFLTWIEQYKDRCGVWEHSQYGQIANIEIRSRDMPLRTLIALRWS